MNHLFVKKEGETIVYDVCQKDFLEPTPCSWMELSIPHNMSRQEVHKKVDDWLGITWELGKGPCFINKY